MNFSDSHSVMMSALYNNIKLPFTSYYMHLKQEALNNMIITLNPTATKSQFVIAKALCEKYAAGAIVKESSLVQNVNLK